MSLGEAPGVHLGRGAYANSGPELKGPQANHPLFPPTPSSAHISRTLRGSKLPLTVTYEASLNLTHPVILRRSGLGGELPAASRATLPTGNKENDGFADKVDWGQDTTDRTSRGSALASTTVGTGGQSRNLQVPLPGEDAFETDITPSPSLVKLITLEEAEARSREIFFSSSRSRSKLQRTRTETIVSSSPKSKVIRVRLSPGKPTSKGIPPPVQTAQSLDVIGTALRAIIGASPRKPTRKPSKAGNPGFDVWEDIPDPSTTLTATPKRAHSGFKARILPDLASRSSTEEQSAMRIGKVANEDPGTRASGFLPSVSVGDRSEILARISSRDRHGEIAGNTARPRSSADESDKDERRDHSQATAMEGMADAYSDEAGLPSAKDRERAGTASGSKARTPKLDIAGSKRRSRPQDSPARSAQAMEPLLASAGAQKLALGESPNPRARKSRRTAGALPAVPVRSIPASGRRGGRAQAVSPQTAVRRSARTKALNLEMRMDSGTPPAAASRKRVIPATERPFRSKPFEQRSGAASRKAAHGSKIPSKDATESKRKSLAPSSSEAARIRKEALRRRHSAAPAVDLRRSEILPQAQEPTSPGDDPLLLVPSKRERRRPPESPSTGLGVPRRLFQRVGSADVRTRRTTSGVSDTETDTEGTAENCFPSLEGTENQADHDVDLALWARQGASRSKRKDPSVRALCMGTVAQSDLQNARGIYQTPSTPTRGSSHGFAIFPEGFLGGVQTKVQDRRGLRGGSGSSQSQPSPIICNDPSVDPDGASEGYSGPLIAFSQGTPKRRGHIEECPGLALTQEKFGLPILKPARIAGPDNGLGHGLGSLPNIPLSRSSSSEDAHTELDDQDLQDPDGMAHDQGTSRFDIHEPSLELSEWLAGERESMSPEPANASLPGTEDIRREDALAIASDNSVPSGRASDGDSSDGIINTRLASEAVEPDPGEVSESAAMYRDHVLIRVVKVEPGIGHRKLSDIELSMESPGSHIAVGKGSETGLKEHSATLRTPARQVPDRLEPLLEQRAIELSIGRTPSYAGAMTNLPHSRYIDDSMKEPMASPTLGSPSPSTDAVPDDIGVQGRSSRSPIDPSMVQIISLDPRAAARAAAILKHHGKYIVSGDVMSMANEHETGGGRKKALKRRRSRYFETIESAAALTPAQQLLEAERELVGDPLERKVQVTGAKTSNVQSSSSPDRAVIKKRGVPPPHLMKWTTREWRDLERCLRRVRHSRREKGKSPQRTEPAGSSRAVDPDVVVARFLELRGVDDDMIEGTEWSKELLCIRVDALSQRPPRSEPDEPAAMQIDSSPKDSKRPKTAAVPAHPDAVTEVAINPPSSFLARLYSGLHGMLSATLRSSNKASSGDEDSGASDIPEGSRTGRIVHVQTPKVPGGYPRHTHGRSEVMSDTHSPVTRQGNSTQIWDATAKASRGAGPADGEAQVKVQTGSGIAASQHKRALEALFKGCINAQGSEAGGNTQMATVIAKPVPGNTPSTSSANAGLADLDLTRPSALPQLPLNMRHASFHMPARPSGSPSVRHMARTYEASLNSDGGDESSGSIGYGTDRRQSRARSSLRRTSSRLSDVSRNEH